MLTSLYIENIAVIEKVSIEFKEGLNVLTGETGAGKSILIDAIHAVLGKRTSKELVRAGAQKASVSAVFENLTPQAKEALDELGYELEDGQLILSRDITADGKNTCKINMRPAVLASLRALAPFLLDIHGQHENQNLTDVAHHIQYIDHFAGLESDLAQYQDAFGQYKEVSGQIQSLSMDQAQKERAIDMLTYQIEEIESANLTVGEEEDLLAKRRLIQNKQKIYDAVQQAHIALSGDDELPGAYSLLQNAAQALNAASADSPQLEAICARLGELSYEAQEFSSQLRDFLEDDALEGVNLDEIESRLNTIYKLKQKYGASEEEILQFLEQSREQLETITLSDEKLQSLMEEEKRLQAICQQRADALSQARKKAGQAFCKRVQEELAFLNMPAVQFECLQQTGKLGQMGQDHMEFFISVNPGEAPKPILKIASGGELSRIMLAIKNVLAGKDDVDSLIFDEIDTGVSGSAAQKIGYKLKQVSKNKQVMCVTHLAQIACLADHHYLIQKTATSAKTFTNIHELEKEERVREIARIIGGDNITALTLQNAREMLDIAQNTAI